MAGAAGRIGRRLAASRWGPPSARLFLRSVGMWRRRSPSRSWRPAALCDDRGQEARAPVASGDRVAADSAWRRTRVRHNRPVNRATLSRLRYRRRGTRKTFHRDPADGTDDARLRDRELPRQARHAHRGGCARSRRALGAGDSHRNHGDVTSGPALPHRGRGTASPLDQRRPDRAARPVPQVDALAHHARSRCTPLSTRSRVTAGCTTGGPPRPSRAPRVLAFAVLNRALVIEVLVVFVAAFLGQLVRRELAERHFNAFGTVMAAATVATSTYVGVLGLHRDHRAGARDPRVRLHLVGPVSAAGLRAHHRRARHGQVRLLGGNHPGGARDHADAGRGRRGVGALAREPPRHRRLAPPST